MHLLVLSAFRPVTVDTSHPRVIGLNAPFGAQCFPTVQEALARWRGMGLNAPFGAQCFPTMRWRVGVWVACPRLNAPFGAQCFPTQQMWDEVEASWKSQCTFWCSVLSDAARVAVYGAA